jgi:hypothetical protein
MSPSDTLFWSLAEPWLSQDGVERATMMRYPCLRYRGAFVACVDAKDGALLVKLPRLEVLAHIEHGAGQSFAPAGRVFREWLSVPCALKDDWPLRLEQAFAHAGASLTSA